MRKIEKVLRGQKSDTPPIWLMRQAGRYLPEYKETRAKAGGFLDLCLNPELASEVTLQPIRRYGFDAAIVFADILIVPYALGQKLWFAEGEGPRLTPLDATASLRFSENKAAPIYETVARVRADLPDDVALIGFCGAPWTVACYMVQGDGVKNFPRIQEWAAQDPDRLQSLIDLLVDVSADYLTAQIKAGAGVVQIFESWAALATDRDIFRRWVIEPTRRLVARVRKSCPDVPVIGFPRGAGESYRDYVEGTGIDAVGLDPFVTMDQARSLQTRCVVQGNLDPEILVRGGKEMDRAIDVILENLAAHPFVFNLGHGIMPQTPPDHVARLVKRVKGFS